MPNQEKSVEPGETYVLYLTAQQHKLLGHLLERQPDDGFKKLKEIVRKATTRLRPYSGMTRQERTVWIHDELLELESETATLQEEMETWIARQKGTHFVHTAQNTEVHENIGVLRGVVATLKTLRQDLKKLKFSGWNRSKKSLKWEETHGPNSPLARSLEERSE